MNRRAIEQLARSQALRQALRGNARLRSDERAKLMLAAQVSVDAIATGAADIGHWKSIFECTNLIEELCSRGLAHDWKDWHGGLQDAIEQALDRARGGVKALRAGELAALREMLDLWGDLLDRVTMRELSAAQEAVAAMTRRVLAERPAGVRIIEAV